MADFFNIKLAKREKNLVVSCAVFLFVVIVWQFLAAPWFSQREQLLAGITSRENDLSEMISMQGKLQAAQDDSHGVLKQLQQRSKNFALFSYLENAAGKNQVKKFITYMKPSASRSQGSLKESLVEIKLAGISLEQLGNYLKQIESPKDVVYIKRVSIQINKKKKGALDAVLQVLTYTNEN